MSGSGQTQEHGDGGARHKAKRRDGGQSKANLHPSQSRTMTRSSQGDLQEISRLRETIGQLNTQGQGFDKEEGLRWRINQLEKDKLELNSKYNQEVSGYEAQLTRCRALLEKGEAQKQTLEYELAVVKRDAAAQKDKLANLITHNQQLEGLTAELHQRASDLQKALEITQQARYEDEQSLKAELRERDHIIHSISTERERLQEENRHLDTLLQDQKDTLHDLKDRMESMQRDRERDGEELRVRMADLRKIMEREERMKKELETTKQKVKTLEESIESERAAHLEFKVNAEVIRLRLRDVEATLSVEKRSQAEAASSLELLKHKFGEVEGAHIRERERADNTQHALTLVKQEYKNTKGDLTGQLEKAKAASADLIGQLEREKAESTKLIGQLEREKAESIKLIGQLEWEKAESVKLIGQLEKEKAESAKLLDQAEQEKVESAKLSVRLQELERIQMGREQELNLVQKRMVFVEQAYEGFLKEIDHLLHHHHHQGATPINTTGHDHSPSALMDILSRVLDRYQTELKDLVKVVDTLNKDNKDKDEIVTDLRRRIQECEARCVHVSKEAEHLRVCAADAAAGAERAQMELQSITHQWEEERERHTHTKMHLNTLKQKHEREEQENLVFLHSLYQRLLTGCVLVATSQSMIGSFSWTQLSIMLQEQADTLTSDLTSANQRIACLENVCEGKEAALKSVCEQLKQREESWIKQREELDTHHTHLTNELHSKAQVLRSRLDHAEESLRVSECSHSTLEQEVARLQELVRVCHRDEASLLAACSLLAGCVCAQHGRVCELVHQKTLLQQRVCVADSLQEEVRALLHALADPGVSGQSRVRRGVWKFRVHVIVAMAAMRLRALRRNTHTLLRVGGGMCVSELRLNNTHVEEEEEERVMKMFTSSQLCVILHTCMEDVQRELQSTERSECVVAAAHSSFTKLIQKLLPESSCYGDVGSLAQRLGHGLNYLRKTHHLPLRDDTNKVMLSALQQHFLVFTQRLHSAEVERRDLRIELSRIKRKNTLAHDGTKSCVPVQQLRSVCEELSSALCREQRAQALLHEQATQLQELGVTMETQTSEQLEKDHTLAQAVQSLSDTKAELKRKEQSLRVLGKRLNQSQQEKQELQQSINRAENTLRMAARSKECLLSYIMSLECKLRELKDRLLLSHSTFSRDDFTLHLPTIQQDTQGLELGNGGAEMKACQALVHSFTDVYELARGKMVCLEREISSYQSHITMLKAELHDACVRENQCNLIGCTERLAPLSEAEGNCGTLSISHTSVAVKNVPSNMHRPHNKSTVPLKKNRSVKKIPQVTKVPQNHEHRNSITH